MKFCTACGHELGVGRFCINCGAPVATPDAPRHAARPTTEPDHTIALDPVPDPIPHEGSHLGAGPTDTAERPAVRAVTPPPAVAAAVPPPKPAAPPTTDYSGRYPLYADEAAGSKSEIADLDEDEPHGSSAWAIVVVVGAVLFLVVALGVWLLGSGGDDSPSTTSTSSGNPSDTQSGDSTSKPSKVSAPKNPQELAESAKASAPVTAPPNQDVSGHRVTYVAANMLDGDPATAWRMPGDGAGQTLTFTLPETAVLTKVGLINGYAKVDQAGKGPEVNWYNRNRKVESVEWSFDDGTTVTQSLDDTLSMQTIKIPPVQTKTIMLKLVDVSPPAQHNGRNYTPVSEVTLVGG